MIKIENLSKTYVTKKKVETQALKDINLVLEDKGMTFIIGKTGCGKSTLLNIIGKLDEPTSGNIYVDGNCLTTMSSKKADSYRDNYVGFVFQEYNLIDNFTVYENIAMIYKIRGEEVDELTIDKYLEKFELTEQKLKRCDELSGGQRQRVCIIRALVKNPKLILADEPTGALDSKTGKDILDILKDLSKDRLVIVVSHDHAAAEKYADRVITIKDGKIKKDSNNKEISYKEKQQNLPIKTKNFKFGEILKLAFTNLGCRWKRLVIMLLISVISFGALGTVFTYFTYDREKIILNSMYNDGVENIYINANDYGNNMSDRMIDVLSEKYNRAFYPTFFNKSFDSITTESYRETNTAYNGSIFPDTYTIAYKTFMEIDNDIAKDLGVKLLYGNYPSADDEIVVSEYFYLDIKYHSNKQKESQNYEPSDLIGKKIKNFTIVGILQTFNHSKYDLLNNIPLNKVRDDNKTQSLYSSLLNYLDTSLNNVFFVNKGYYDRNLCVEENIKQNTIDSEFSFFYSKNSFYDDDFLKIKSYDFYKDDYLYVWKDGVEKQSLSNNEVLLYINDDFFLTSRYHIQDKKFNNKTLFSHIVSERQNILNENNNINPYQEEYLLEFNAIKNVFETMYFDVFEYIYFNVNRTNSQFNIDFNKVYNVVGIAYEKPETVTGHSFDTDYLLIANNDVITDIRANLYVYEYSGAYTTTKTMKEDMNLLKTISSVYTPISPSNVYITNMNSIEGILKTLSQIMLYVGLCLAVFSGLLFYNYMSVIIDDKRRQTGILRSMGASKYDIALLFFIECLIVASIIILISSGFAAIMSVVLNNVLALEFSFLYSIFNFNIVSVLMIIAVSLIVSVLASTAPIIKMSKQKPIQMLND